MAVENVTITPGNSPFSGDKQVTLKVEMGEPLPGFVEIVLAPHEAIELAEELRAAAETQ